jgi:CspA family cold shock protein
MYVPADFVERRTVATGTVNWSNSQKGYGLIEPDDGSTDAFLHISAVERSRIGYPNEGQKIGFGVERGRNGKARP